MAQTKITSNSLSLQSVETKNIKDRSVVANKIDFNAVKSEHILNQNVGFEKFAPTVTNYFSNNDYLLTQMLPLSGGTVTGLIKNSTIPAFHARGYTVPATVAASEIGGYAFVDLNQGNCFNGTTGRFTAPVDGVYYFYFNTLNAFANAADTRISFRKNGATSNRQFVVTKAVNTWHTFYGMGVFSLLQNDYISLFLETSNSLSKDNTNEGFGGFFIG